MSVSKICDNCGKEEGDGVVFKAFTKSNGEDYDLCPMCVIIQTKFLETYLKPIEDAMVKLMYIKEKLWDGWLDSLPYKVREGKNESER